MIGLVLCFFENTRECQDEKLLKMYLIVLGVFHVILLIYELIIVIISSRGTIAKPGPRKCLPVFFCCQILVFMMKFIWDIVGVLWAFNPLIDCPSLHKILLFTRGVLLWNFGISVMHGLIFLTFIGEFKTLLNNKNFIFCLYI